MYALGGGDPLTHDCPHDHQQGLLAREWDHLRSHWLSCAGFCIFTHAIWHGLEWLASKL